MRAALRQQARTARRHVVRSRVCGVPGAQYAAAVPMPRSTPTSPTSASVQGPPRSVYEWASSLHVRTFTLSMAAETTRVLFVGGAREFGRWR
jgi:hypothetical protein